MVRNMSEREFLDLCRSAIVSYVNEHTDKSDLVSIKQEDVYMVWCCKTLQNNKALLSTTLPDGMYYECTYNGDNGEFYLDAYKKFQHICHHVGKENE